MAGQQYLTGGIDMKLKTWQKNVLSAVSIAAGGFVLFNIAFMLAAGVSGALNWIIGLFSKSRDFAVNMRFGLYLFVLIVLASSWFIFKSKLKPLIKAIYLPMPLMVVLIVGGIHLFGLPQWVPICAGAAVVGGVLFYLYKKKLSWLYYFAALYTGVMALLVVVLGIEI